MRCAKVADPNHFKWYPVLSQNQVSSVYQKMKWCGVQKPVHNLHSILIAFMILIIVTFHI